MEETSDNIFAKKIHGGRKEPLYQVPLGWILAPSTGYLYEKPSSKITPLTRGNKYRSHGLGTVFLEQFIDSRYLTEPEETGVYIEYDIRNELQEKDRKGLKICRADIFAGSNSFASCFELKMGWDLSGINLYQIQKYISCLNLIKKDKHVYFCLIHSKEVEQEDIIEKLGNYHDKFVEMGGKILPWKEIANRLKKGFDKVKGEIPDRTRIYISDYINYVKNR